jgi:hypothetical protein
VKAEWKSVRGQREIKEERLKRKGEKWGSFKRRQASVK